MWLSPKKWVSCGQVSGWLSFIYTSLFQPAHFDFLQHFVGKHELLLNSLKSRYRAKTIDCFITFFQEPWTELIMHEKFGDLQAENRDLLKPMAVSTLTVLFDCSIKSNAH